MVESFNQQPDQEKTPEVPGTDTQSIVHRHMNDKNDIITDEDIRNVQVGETTEPVTIGAEAEARLEDEDEEENNTGSKPVTPWDTIDS